MQLNNQDSKQEFSVKFSETISPVFNWTTVINLLVLTILNIWKICQFEFLIEYPQEKLERHAYLTPTRD